MGALQPRPATEPAASETLATVGDETREMMTQTFPALHVTVRTPFALTPASKVNYGQRRAQLGTAGGGGAAGSAGMGGVCGIG